MSPPNGDDREPEPNTTDSAASTSLVGDDAQTTTSTGAAANGKQPSAKSIDNMRVTAMTIIFLKYRAAINELTPPKELSAKIARARKGTMNAVGDAFPDMEAKEFENFLIWKHTKEYHDASYERKFTDNFDGFLRWLAKQRKPCKMRSPDTIIQNIDEWREAQANIPVTPHANPDCPHCGGEGVHVRETESGIARLTCPCYEKDPDTFRIEWVEGQGWREVEVVR
jgi:hypothetical protein